MRKFCPLFYLMSAALFLAGCTSPRLDLPGRSTSEEEKIVRFPQGNTHFYAADGYSNGGVFGCSWKRSNAVMGDTLQLALNGEGGNVYGAEYRSRESTSFGFYSVSMKAARCSGVISSFFTYTNRPVWDEIDIEFLGKDTTRVQFNYYCEGKGGHEVWYDLGFDGADSFHEYAFLWQPDAIIFYVDGAAVHRAEEEIPRHPMQIMMNIWNCIGVEDWSGPFTQAGLPVSAEYEWIGFSAVDHTA